MKKRVPGVVSSIGLYRLLAGLSELGKTATRASFTDAAVFCQKEANMALYHKIAVSIRAQGMTCEVFPDGKKFLQQYAWAEKKSIKWEIRQWRLRRHEVYPQEPRDEGERRDDDE